jgi:hypothetical protein
MDIVAYHDTRRPDWYEAGALRGELEAVRQVAGRSIPIYLQEPMPFRKFHPDCGHGESPKVGVARQAVKHARDQGAAAWTFHTRQSFDLRRRTLLAILQDDPEQMAELEAVAQIQ